MNLTRLRGACDPKPTCPTLYLTDQASFIVQGYIVTAPARPLPEDEGEVEVPVSMLWTSPAAPPDSPAVRLTDHGTAIVRGHLINDIDVLARLSLPEGEAAVEVQVSILPEVMSSAQ
ncbi:hypothetical protein BJF79_08600 [Actinomadura sp. CNU-125]|uniref:hypothetical protein n=1 Tax=Actinomadura sp. CNU-125 TaxID=1904961 RepID=UPI000962F43F|nr:hypothetical protein [Actinomadura sp. CNU-125]OLT31844.1 hypothetical protein BJF79_08600 [Actinomadura sp. CNU-125]